MYFVHLFFSNYVIQINCSKEILSKNIWAMYDNLDFTAVVIIIIIVAVIIFVVVIITVMINNFKKYANVLFTPIKISCDEFSFKGISNIPFPHELQLKGQFDSTFFQTFNIYATFISEVWNPTSNIINLQSLLICLWS